MTQWKVGDKAEIVALSENIRDDVDIGDIATVIAIDPSDNTPIFDVDLDKEWGWVNAGFIFRPIITRKRKATYETITINGKLYSLVPVEAS